MNRVVKRRVLKRIRALEKKGLSLRQIADHLNKQAVLVSGEAGKWNDGTIARLFGEDREGMLYNDRK
jgi:DNA-binding transcriptional MerR regulator